MRVVLASASPRRKALLEQAGVHVEVCPVNVDETVQPGEAPAALVRRLAREKALAAGQKERPVIAADTEVVFEGRSLGKPATNGEAAEMLARLSGSEHEVITGVCIRGTDGTLHELLSRTRVHFRVLSAAEIDAYIATGEPMDKAGGYGIQAGAAHMVLSLQGSYTNVVGLPMAEVMQTLNVIGNKDISSQ